MSEDKLRDVMLELMPEFMVDNIAWMSPPDCADMIKKWIKTDGDEETQADIIAFFQPMKDCEQSGADRVHDLVAKEKHGIPTAAELNEALKRANPDETQE